MTEDYIEALAELAFNKYELLRTSKTYDFLEDIISLHKTQTTNINYMQELFVQFSQRNFGPHHSTGYRNLLGAMEELGELAHAHLKGEQGIRHTPEEIIEKKKDAVGDIFAFLCNYCDSQGLTLHECIVHAWNEIKDRDFKKDPINGGISKDD